MQLPLEALPLKLPSALLGQIAVFAAFLLIIWALAREAARWVIKILLVVGIALGVALWAGWLNQSEVARWLERIGDWLILGIKAVVEWITRAGRVATNT
jgi:hypothetical protein